MENKIGKRIGKARNNKNLTQQQFSELINMSISEISRIENGKVSPTIDTLICFSQALDVSLNYILADYLEDTSYPQEIEIAISKIISKCEDPQKLIEYFDALNRLLR